MSEMELWSQAEPRRKHTEASLAELLRQRYTRIRRGTNADRYVRARHVQYPDDFGYTSRIADYMAIDNYKPQSLIGFEIKTSRSDWLAELAQPDKAEAWRQHCHRWYLVASHPEIVRNDLPAGWGMLVVSGGQLVQQKRSATNTAPLPMPIAVLGRLGRAIANTAAAEPVTPAPHPTTTGEQT